MKTGEKLAHTILKLLHGNTFVDSVLMGPQVGPVRKFLSTLGTAKWFLPGVGPHVSLQQPGAGESLATQVTLVAEVVGEDVHGEGIGACVCLFAGVTSLGCLAGQLQVKFLVSHQV